MSGVQFSTSGTSNLEHQKELIAMQGATAIVAAALEAKLIAASAENIVTYTTVIKRALQA